MAQDSMTADELKREIEEAFADVPYPGDDQLEEPYPSDVGGMEVFRGCRWQDWKDKPWDLLSKVWSDCCLFKPAALHYFLPLYMIAGLIDFDHAGNLCGQAMGIFSSLPNLGDLDKRLQARLRPMSVRQVSVLISWLEMMLRDHFDEATAYIVEDDVAYIRQYRDRRLAQQSTSSDLV